MKRSSGKCISAFRTRIFFVLYHSKKFISITLFEVKENYYPHLNQYPKYIIWDPIGKLLSKKDFNQVLFHIYGLLQICADCNDAVVDFLKKSISYFSANVECVWCDYLNFEASLNTWCTKHALHATKRGTFLNHSLTTAEQLSINTNQHSIQYIWENITATRVQMESNFKINYVTIICNISLIMVAYTYLS